MRQQPLDQGAEHFCPYIYDAGGARIAKRAPVYVLRQLTIMSVCRDKLHPARHSPLCRGDPQRRCGAKRRSDAGHDLNGDSCGAKRRHFLIGSPEDHWFPPLSRTTRLPSPARLINIEVI
jgi:hypothetical protein